MTPVIENIPSKILVGKKILMSLNNNRTAELWKSFMPFRMEITGRISEDLYSLQVYDNDMDFSDFDPGRTFEKWALAEVSGTYPVPSGMESFKLPAGLYAVFDYKGPASKGSEFFRYIFETWIPGSDFIVDTRPHFEILGSQYKNEDPDSEERICIPVRPRGIIP